MAKTETEREEIAYGAYAKKFPYCAITRTEGPFRDQDGEFWLIHDENIATAPVRFYVETEGDQANYCGKVTVKGQRRAVYLTLIEGYSGVDNLFHIIQEGAREFFKDASTTYQSVAAAEAAIHRTCIAHWHQYRRELSPKFRVEITGD